MFAGINMFLARLRLRVKMSLRRAKNIYAQEHQLYYYYNKFKGQYIPHKNIKIDCKQSNGRLSASCIYFVVLLITTNCLFKKQKKNENHFQNTKRRMKNNSLQITSDSWYKKSKSNKKLYSTVCNK